MRNRRILVGLTTLAVVVAGAMTAFTPAVSAGPSGGSAAAAGSRLVRAADGSVHAVLPARPLARPAGFGEHAAPAAIAKAFLADRAGLFGARASDLQATQTVGFGSRGSTVRFQQSLGGLPVLGGELVVSLDATGALRSITGEAASGPLADSGLAAGAQARQAAQARAYVAKRTGVGQLTARRLSAVVYNPQLLGVPGGADVNLRADRILVTGPGISYFVFVHGRLGVLGGFSTAEEANNRVVCAANNKVLYPDEAYCEGGNDNVRVMRQEGDGPSSDKDTNNVYNNLGYTQQAYTNFAQDLDLASNIGLSGIEAGGRYGTVKRLRATVHYCQPEDACPMQNAFWNDTYDAAGKVVGGQMYYGFGLTQDDITGHEVSHGVTAATSNLLYWFQSGAINESMSDVFGELIDLMDYAYGAPVESSANAWLIGEGSPIGVIRSMKNPPSVKQWDGSKGQPDKMTSTNWWDVGADEDSGGVHLNSGVGNKAAYLIAAGGTFNGQTIRKLGRAKAFAIYWTTENLLTSGANYRDLYTALQTACSQNIGVAPLLITPDDCDQVRKAVVATEMNKNARATDNLPVSTSYCPSGTTMQTTMSEGFDTTPADWDGVRLTKRDEGFDYVKSGDDSAITYGGATHSLRHTAGVVVPANGWLRINYAVFDSFGNQGSVMYRTGTPSAPLKWLPTAGSVNPGPWGMSPGWSSAKWNLSSIPAGTRIYLRFATDDPTGSTALLVDNVAVYRCT